MAPTISYNIKIMGRSIKWGLGLSVNLAIYDHNLIKKLSVVHPR